VEPQDSFYSKTTTLFKSEKVILKRKVDIILPKLSFQVLFKTIDELEFKTIRQLLEIQKPKT
jgi:hypothetical protein